MHKAIVYTLRYLSLFYLSFAAGFFAKDGAILLFIAALLVMLAFCGLDYKAYMRGELL